MLIRVRGMGHNLSAPGRGASEPPPEPNVSARGIHCPGDEALSSRAKLVDGVMADERER